MVRLAWTALQPSAIEARWRRIGQAGLLIATAVLLTALVGNDAWSTLRWPVAMLIVLASAVMLYPVPSNQWQIAIDDHGNSIGRTDTGDQRRLQCVFESSWLIAFRAGRQLIPVWPDSLPDGGFRRLRVYLRWHLTRDGDVGTPESPSARPSK